jgi:hypothetical protein
MKLQERPVVSLIRELDGRDVVGSYHAFGANRGLGPFRRPVVMQLQPDVRK